MLDAAILVLSVATIIVLLVLAVVLVNREDASHTAADARIAILSEGTLSAASALENASTQVLLAVTLARTNDAIDGEVAATAVGALDQTATELHRRFEVMAGDLTAAEYIGAIEVLTALDEATAALIAAAGDGDIEAVAAAVSNHASAYQLFVERFVDIRDGYVEGVLLAGRGLGRVADAVRFLVFFFVPLIVIIAYRRGSRRRDTARQLEEALESELMLTQSRDDFIASLSQELRTPLTGIYGFALALQEIADLKDEDYELVTHIVNDAADLTRMVDDLITAGRITAGTLAVSMDDVRLEPLVLEVAEVFKMRDVTIEMSLQDAVVHADPRGMRQMLMNLVSNADRHGGDEITINAFVEGDMAAIRVIDNGPGVPEEIQPLLFNRYLHGDRRALLNGSIGLGTAVAYAFAKSFGGTIEYRRVDDLTVFEILLPAVFTDDADELHQQSVAGRLHDATMEPGDPRVDQLSTVKSLT